MGKEDKKTTTDVLFKKKVCNVLWNVRTQMLDKPIYSWDIVEDCLMEMFDDEEEFVTLTAADIRYNIRYVQACQISDGIIVQLGIEEGNNTKLVEKVCGEKECLDIFKEFYASTQVRNLEKYTPVEFLI